MHKHFVFPLQPNSKGLLCAESLLGGPISSQDSGGVQGPLAEGADCHLEAELVSPHRFVQCKVHLWHEISTINCPGEEAAFSAVQLHRNYQKKLIPKGDHMGCNAEAQAGFCLWLLPLRTEGRIQARSVFLVRDLLHQNGAGNENRVPLNTQATSNKNASRNSFFCSLPCSCPAAEDLRAQPSCRERPHVSPNPADGTRLSPGHPPATDPALLCLISPILPHLPHLGRLSLSCRLIHQTETIPVTLFQRWFPNYPHGLVLLLH